MHCIMYKYVLTVLIFVSTEQKLHISVECAFSMYDLGNFASCNTYHTSAKDPNVNFLKRLDFPTAESPMRMTLNW